MGSPSRQRLTQGSVTTLACVPGKSQTFLWDSEVPGLGVRATPSGSRAFIFQSGFQGGDLRVTIGDVRVLTLAEARAKARTFKNQISEGIDPRQEKRKRQDEREAAEQEAERMKRRTLRALCAAYVDYLSSRGKVKSARDVKSSFHVHVLSAWPSYADLPANQITSHQIADIVRKVLEAGKERASGILRSYLSAAFNLARHAPFDPTLPSDLSTFAVTTNPVEIIQTIPVGTSNRTLSNDELGAYAAALNDHNADVLLQVALRTCCQRIAQLCRAQVSDYDPSTKVLRLWDSKGKRTVAREHLLPLPPVAASIVQGLVDQRKSTSDPLFSVGPQMAGIRAGEISDDLGGEPFNLRDLRRTCETMLASMRVPKDLRAQLLSHGISGVQDRHYDRHDYLDEKRDVLARWEARLAEITPKKRPGDPGLTVTLD